MAAVAAETDRRPLGKFPPPCAVGGPPSWRLPTAKGRPLRGAGKRKSLLIQSFESKPSRSGAGTTVAMSGAATIAVGRATTAGGTPGAGRAPRTGWGSQRDLKEI